MKQIAKKKSGNKFIRFLLIAGVLFAAVVIGRIIYFESVEYHPHLVGRVIGVDNVKVGLKWVHNAQFAGLYTAIDSDFFRNRDLNIILSERDLSKPSDLAGDVNSGRFDFGITNSIDLLQGIEKGDKIKAIAAIYQRTPSSIISLTSSNILTPADLRGKKLGISSKNADSVSLFKALLKKYNVHEDEVEFVVIGPDPLSPLIEKRVDAVSAYRTDVGRARFEGKNSDSFRIMLPGEHGINIYGDVVITSEKMIKEKPEVVQKFINGLIDGWKKSYEDPELAIASTLKRSSGIHGNEWTEKYILSSLESLVKIDDNTPIGSMTKSKWEETITTFYEFRVIDKQLNPQDVYTDQFIQ